MPDLKILHIGLCVYKIRESSLSQAFKRATNNYFELALDEKHLQQKAVMLAKSIKPDIVFLQLQAEGIVHQQTARAIKEHSGCVINWTGDVRQPTPQWFFDIAKEIDITSFTNMHDINIMREKGFKSEFIQQGYDPNIFYPSDGKRDIDIVFMGNGYGTQFPLSKSRHEMIAFLKKRYGKRFRVYGNSQLADGNLNHCQVSEAQIYRRAKIGINYSHFNLERYTSDRMLRLMGCGATCLSHKFKGIEQDFIEGENVVTWETFSELAKKIDENIDRADIGQAGAKWVKDRFTFDHMVKEIINASYSVLPATLRG